MTAAQYRALAKLHTRMSDIYFNEAMKLDTAKEVKKKKSVKKKAIKKKTVKRRGIQLR